VTGVLAFSPVFRFRIAFQNVILSVKILYLKSFNDFSLLITKQIPNTLVQSQSPR
jgi:hypothetical protein